MKFTTLTKAEFARVQAASRITPETVSILKRILLNGESQATIHHETGKSRQHINLMVKRFMARYEEIHALPEGWRREMVALPSKDWPKVRKLEQQAKLALTKKTKQEG